jgi:5-formyltetrahydrofolate cyclo-ligase
VKGELRKRARSLRKATPAEACHERSLQIIARLGELEVLRAATSVALFWPIEERHEVDLRSFDAALRARGVRVAYPMIHRQDLEPNDAADVVTVAPAAPSMTFHFVDDVTSLVDRGSGFEEPAAEAPVVSADLRELDVVVVPALAVDPTGYRIGYGAGYYDRALAGTRVVKVAVIFDFQLLSEIPATEGDVAVDWVVTDRRVLAVEQPATQATETPFDPNAETPWPS